MKWKKMMEGGVGSTAVGDGGVKRKAEEGLSDGS